jgi:hypothetical protein
MCGSTRGIGNPGVFHGYPHLYPCPTIWVFKNPGVCSPWRTLHSPIDSRWNPVDSTWTYGLQVDSRWIFFGRELCQIMAKFHLESTWTPDGPQKFQVDSMDSTPHAPNIGSQWTPPGFWWTPHNIDK